MTSPYSLRSVIITCPLPLQFDEDITTSCATSTRRRVASTVGLALYMAHTINWIMKDWPSGCFPDDAKWQSVWGDNVRFAVLTHNQSSQFKDPDYYVWTVNKAEEDCWLVYPWEEFWL